jgi:hypothetical protein
MQTLHSDPIRMQPAQKSLGRSFNLLLRNPYVALKPPL